MNSREKETWLKERKKAKINYEIKTKDRDRF